MSQSFPFPENDEAVLHFRPLQESDHDQIKSLHEALFPVKYSAEFYDNVVCNKTTGGCPLLSRVAVIKGFDEESCSSLEPQNDSLVELAEFVGIPAFEEDELENIVTISNNGKTKTDHIIGCIIGAFMKHPEEDTEDNVSHKLTRDPSRHTNLFYIMTLGTTEEYRKQRLGTKMIQDCLTMVEQVPSCGGIYLHVITYNAAAIKFYERLGFYRIEEIEGA
jgi:ribosomal protein S18 acetylase RimI-like enzyme